MIHRNQDKRRKSLWKQLTVLTGLIIVCALSFSDDGKTQTSGLKTEIIASQKTPIAEGSALIPYGNEFLILGDRKPEVFLTEGFSTTQMKTQKNTPGSLISFGAQLINEFGGCIYSDGKKCKALMKLGLSDWEGAASDGEQFLFLQEYSNTILHLNASFEKVHEKIYLDFRSLINNENNNDNLMGEGILMMKNGHVLIAKERSPAAIIEFGPSGDQPLGKNGILSEHEKWNFKSNTLVPLAAWSLGKHSKCDISDITFSKDTIFILSETCHRIQEIAIDSKGKSQNYGIKNTYFLPKKVKHPEGLTRLDDGSFLVLSDTKKKKKSLFHIKVKTNP